MSTVRRLRVQNFRVHQDRQVELSAGATLIIGPNGSGKTSLIEALYIALQGSSFKGSDTELIRHGQSWYRIDVSFSNDRMMTVKFDSTKTARKKQFESDSEVSYRFKRSLMRPVVLFEPDDLRLFTGSPARRRNFIDRLISQTDAEYGLSLSRYERALKQRNALLKHPEPAGDSLFAWNVMLARYGAYLITARLQVLAFLRQRLGATYASIAGKADVVAISYSHPYHGNIEQTLLGELDKSVSRDWTSGFTSTGPHRHDLLFSLNGQSAASVASRGEARTLVLALKFLEVDIVETALHEKPIIMLDDVYSELDNIRQQKLTNHFARHQTLITSVTGHNLTIPGSVLSLS